MDLRAVCFVLAMIMELLCALDEMDDSLGEVRRQAGVASSQWWLLLLLRVNVLLVGLLTLSPAISGLISEKKMNLPAVTTAGKSGLLVMGESVRHHTEHRRNSKKLCKYKQNDARQKLLKGQIL